MTMAEFVSTFETGADANGSDTESGATNNGDWKARYYLGQVCCTLSDFQVDFCIL